MAERETLTELLLDRLTRLRPSIEEQWRSPVGSHTRHFIIDDLLPVDLCRRIHGAFPAGAAGFFRRDSFRERKKTATDLGALDPILSDITYAFQDRRVVELIGSAIGVPMLEPDPLLYAAGLSMMVKGDFLNPHIDNSHDRERRRYRRLNLLYYVSPGWALEDGGNFELWDARCRRAKTIVSATNRLLVMETSRTSWHGVSPVSADRPRCCVSTYYFSKQSPEATEYFHVTSFTGRPEERWRRALGIADNALRGAVARVFKAGRGRNQINAPKG